MTAPANHGLDALTEREKQALRLIVRGHDAKSVARSLDRSVHTINERLRDARRKLAVASSREAARLLFEAEGGVVAIPKFVRDATIGEDALRDSTDHDEASATGAGRPHRSWLTAGVVFMILAFALLALAASSEITVAQSTVPSPAVAAASSDTVNPAIVAAAREWLTLVDQSRWDESYRATGAAFRKLNTAKVWAETSQKVRVPLGAVATRTFLSEQNVPAPPAGYEVVKFRTDFAVKAGAIETVSLESEAGVWRVVGIIID